MKNGIIINGRAYKVRYMAYNQINIKEVCYKCALVKRCSYVDGSMCATFERKGKIPYFEKIK